MTKIEVKDTPMMVEEIAFKYRLSLFPNDYDRAAQVSGFAEQIYTLNSGVAAKGQMLPIGTVLQMPDIEDEKTSSPNSLWG